MGKITIGAPDYLSARPLVYGLECRPQSDIVLVYGEPGELAAKLENRQVDVALIPSIEFLRGVGGYFVEGAGLSIHGRTNGILLATDSPIADLRRVAVAENSRTPVAVLRILLDKVHGVLPDFCVFKQDPDTWRDEYDAILLTGDQGLQYCLHKLRGAETCHDVGEMWHSLFPTPLVVALWAYNDEEIGAEVADILIRSRDYGLTNLSQLADDVSQTTVYDSQFIYDFLSRGWGYHVGREDEGGLKVLEDHAMEYQLIQQRRLDAVLARHG